MSHRNITAFDAGTDVVVIGTNPEMADYDNPRGEIYGFSAYVRARNEYGDTYCTTVGRAGVNEQELIERADKLAAALQARLDNLGKLPLDFDRWVQGRPVYGSQAYIDYGADDDIAWEREAEFA